MPNLKHAKKAVRKSEARYDVNRKVKDRITRWANKAKLAIKEKAKDEAIRTFTTLTKLIDKAAKEHVVSENKAARTKSRIQSLINAL